jgi:hypothetical protein
MDTIELAPMRLTRSAFFRLLVMLRARKSGWIYALFLLVGILSLIYGPQEQAPLGLLLIVLPFIMLAVLLHWAIRKDNQHVYEERSFVLDEEKLIGITAGGGRSEVPWSYVKRLVEIDGRYLLYISAGQMIILDKVAFPDKASEERFLYWVNKVRDS